MSNATSIPVHATRGDVWRFEFTVLAIVLATAALSGSMPIGFSIVTVFALAGPHNWLEARYMLARMPAKWGKLRPYFLTGIIGASVLGLASAAIPHTMNQLNASHETWLLGTGLWNAAFGIWVLFLIHLRSRQKPVRNWSWTIPAGLAIVAAGVMWPVTWSLVLVYTHPLMALWFLDRELGYHRPHWQKPYRRCLFLVPIALAVMCSALSSLPNLPGDDVLSMQITHHAGAGILDGVSTHVLVSAHVFLEMLHYAVWVVAIPLIGIGRLPTQLSGIPLVGRSRRWKITIASLLIFGAMMTLALWAGFLADYPLARDIYFTVAILHVLAEVPFLLRLL